MKSTRILGLPKKVVGLESRRRRRRRLHAADEVLRRQQHNRFMYLARRRDGLLTTVPLCGRLREQKLDLKKRCRVLKNEDRMTTAEEVLTRQQDGRFLNLARRRWLERVAAAAVAGFTLKISPFNAKKVAALFTF